MKPPKVSIVVPTWNGLDLLKKSLPAVSEIDYPDYQVVVVDGGSTDGSIRYIEKCFPNFKVVKLSRNLGVAGNMNEAIPHVDGEYVCFVDNDLIVNPDIVGKIVGSFLQYNDVGMVGGHIQDLDGTTYSAGFFDGYTFRMKKHVGEAVYITGVCMCFRTKALKQVRGFDSNIMMGCDDFDVALRLRHAGWRIWALPNLVGLHLRSRSVKKFKAKAHYYALLGRLYTYLKDFSLKTGIKLVMFHTVWQTKNNLSWIFRRHSVKVPLFVTLAYLALVTRLPLIVKQRRMFRRTELGNSYPLTPMK